MNPTMIGSKTQSKTPFVLSIVFLMIAAANAEATIPDKHLPMAKTDRLAKLETDGMEIETIRVDPENPIPVVVSSHTRQISLHWWGPAGWEQIKVVDHEALQPLEPIAEESAVYDRETYVPFSNRVAIASGGEYVYLFYKRALTGEHSGTGLFVSTFRWDGSIHKVVPVDGPSLVPLDDETVSVGHFLWAGYSDATNRIVLLLQTAPSAMGQEGVFKLVLHAFAPGHSDQIERVTVSQGGYRFDARIEDKMLQLLVRTHGYTVGIQSSMRVEHVVLSEDNMNYAPFDRVTIDLSSLTVTKREEGWPGGENPQIQHLNPFIYTMDRIRSGSVRKRANISIKTPGGVQVPPPYPMWLTLDLQSSKKVLVMDRGDRWITSDLFHFSEESIPRNLARRTEHDMGGVRASRLSIFDSLFHFEREFGVVLWNRPAERLPVFMTGLEKVDEKTTQLDFIHRDEKFDCLSIVRYQINTSDTQSTASRIQDAVFDINHKQIPHHNRLVPGAFSENAQFAPFEMRQIYDSGLSDGYFNQWVRTPQLDVINTIGGALRKHGGMSEGMFVAYTDLGDGGMRVVFDRSVSFPKPDSRMEKYVVPKDVVGPGLAIDKWVTIKQDDVEHDWDFYGLEAYKEVMAVAEFSPVTGVDSLIDTLAEMWEGPFDVDGHIQVTKVAIDSLQNNETWNPNPPVDSDGEPDETTGNYAAFQFSESVYAGYPTRFDATSTQFAPFTAQDLSYTWVLTQSVANTLQEIGTYTFHGNPVFETTLENPGVYTVALTVSAPNDETLGVEQDISVQTGLWDSLWEFQANLSSSDADPDTVFNVYDCELEFSKYVIRFRFDENLARKDVILELKDRHVAKYAFNGGLGQGSIHMELPIRFSTDQFSIEKLIVGENETDLAGLVNAIAKVNSVETQFEYGRVFTPAVLSRELKRSVIDVFGRRHSGLSTKPVQNTYFSVQDVTLDLDLTVGGYALMLLVSVFLELLVVASIIGFATAWSLSHLRRQFVIYSGMPGMRWAAALCLAAFIAIIRLTVVPAIEQIVERSVAEQLEQSSVKNALDHQSGMIDNAGQGLAAALAARVMDCVRPFEDGYESDYLADEDKELYPDLPRPQIHRSDMAYPDFWQMIFVSERECKILIREK